LIITYFCELVAFSKHPDRLLVITLPKLISEIFFFSAPIVFVI